MKRRWLIGLGLVFVALYTFPYFPELRSANEVPRIFLTQEIVDRQTFQLDARWAELSRGSTFDVSTTPDGHRYSNKAPGASLLAVPGYLALKALKRASGEAPTLGEITWVCRVSAVTLPALLFLLAFAAGARRMGDHGLALAAYALGSMALPYAILFFSHQIAAAAVGAAFILAWRRGPALDGVGIGLLLGLGILCDYQAALGVAVVGLYFLWRSRSRLRDFVFCVAGGLPPIAALALYHWACFGAPWRTGYSFAVDPAQKKGVLGIVGPNAGAVWQGLFAPDNGLFFLSPWILVAIITGVALLARREVRKKIGPELVVCLAVVALYLLFICSTEPEFGRAGWSVGPRYLAVAIPFAGWLLAAAAGHVRNRVFLTVATATVFYSIAVHVIAATTYPHWPVGVSNPLWEISIRALREGLAPYSVASFAGWTGAWTLAPVYLAALAVTAALSWRRLAVPALVIAALAFAATARVPSTTPPRKWEFVHRTWAPVR